MPFARTSEPFTYADYLTWPEDERWEIIQGHPHCMAPAPSTNHQRVLANLFTALRAGLVNTPCTPWLSPVDVVLTEHDVVQPDLVVVCEAEKITPECIRGAPDVAVEILSPATARKDRKEKKDLYERAGVREYLLLDPEAVYAEHFIRGADERFGTGSIYGAEEVLRFPALGGLEVSLAEVFGGEAEQDRK